MKTKFICSLVLAYLSIGCYAQVNTEGNCENPRGVYKLMSVKGKDGQHLKEPFDQYKICTDSISLMLTISGNRISLGKQDKNIINYTGEEPDPKNNKTTRIYDSNNQHFTLKWWSETKGHLLFGEKEWVTEFYESHRYSLNGKEVIYALMDQRKPDPKNKLIGGWRIIGKVDELKDMKNEIKNMQDAVEKNQRCTYLVLNEKNCIMFNTAIMPVVYNSKNSITISNETHTVIPIDKTHIAVSIKNCNGYDYHIWERIPDDVPLFSMIAHGYLSQYR